jgi:hypothetical protein
MKSGQSGAGDGALVPAKLASDCCVIAARNNAQNTSTSSTRSPEVLTLQSQGYILGTSLRPQIWLPAFQLYYHLHETPASTSDTPVPTAALPTRVTTCATYTQSSPQIRDTHYVIRRRLRLLPRQSEPGYWLCRSQGHIEEELWHKECKHQCAQGTGAGRRILH